MTNVYSSRIRTSFFLSALTLGALGPATHALAQSQAVSVRIPFAFESGAQHLPAGYYQVEFESEHMIALRNTKDHRAGFVMTNPVIHLRASDTGKISFRDYGNRHFLHEVWMPGNSTGWECVRSRAERQVQIAANAVVPTNVELAFTRLPR